MPPKPKSKKGGLTDKQIENTISVVTQYWPDYPISLENIRKPTREFVIKFYTECVNNFDEKFAFLLRSDIISPLPTGLTEEEILFQKLSRFNVLIEADFKLGDLYQFEPKRLNHHIFLVVHFLLFSETCMDQMLATCNQVFDTNVKMQHDKLKRDQLREEIIAKQIQLTKSKEQNEAVKKEAKVIALQYDETLMLTEETEINCKEPLLEIKRIKKELENIEEEIFRLQNTETILRKQIVPENEYTTLLNIFDSLVENYQRLEDIDKSNALFIRKVDIEQMQQCLQQLEDLEIPEMLFKLSEIRVQLQTKHQNLENVINDEAKEESDIQQTETKLNIKSNELKLECSNLEQTFKAEMDQMLLDEQDLNKKYQQCAKTGHKQIEELQSKVKTVESNHDNLGRELLKKYKQILEMQWNMFARFKHFGERLG